MECEVTTCRNATIRCPSSEAHAPTELHRYQRSPGTLRLERCCPLGGGAARSGQTSSSSFPRLAFVQLRKPRNPDPGQECVVVGHGRDFH